MALTVGSILQYNGGPNTTLIGGFAGISLSGNTAGVTSIISTGTAVFAGGNNITLSQNGQSVTISAISVPTISYFEPFQLQEATPVLVGILSATGSTAASAANNPFGSSLSLQRIWLPGNMNVSEMDLAFSINFPATNQGQGTMSQSFGLYRMVGGTSLSSVLTASRTASWTTGTTTSGTASTLQQGWQGAMIQPMTFAGTSVSLGDYVVANLLSWAAANTSWTITVFGANAIGSTTSSAVTDLSPATVALTAFTATPTVAGGISSGGLVGVSAFTASGSAAVISNAGTALMNILSTAGTGAVTMVKATVATTASTTGSALAVTVFTATPTNIARTDFTAAPTVANMLSSNGLSAGSFFSVTSPIAVLSNIGTGIFNPITAAATITGATTVATSTLYPFGYNGSFGMTTNTTQASYLWGPFGNGIMATGSMPANITLSSTAVTVSGSLALVQPWFCLVGS